MFAHMNKVVLILVTCIFWEASWTLGHYHLLSDRASWLLVEYVVTGMSQANVRSLNNNSIVIAP
jgi:hypothetical protein